MVGKGEKVHESLRRMMHSATAEYGYAGIEANWVTAGTFAANDSVISFQTFCCICFPRTLVTISPGLGEVGQ